MLNNLKVKHKFGLQVLQLSKMVEIVTVIIRNTNLVRRLIEDSSIWLETESQLGLSSWVGYECRCVSLLLTDPRPSKRRTGEGRKQKQEKQRSTNLNKITDFVLSDSSFPYSFAMFS